MHVALLTPHRARAKMLCVTDARHLTTVAIANQTLVRRITNVAFDLRKGVTRASDHVTPSAVTGG